MKNTDNLKSVRIDSKTIIYVSKEVSDSQAITSYNDKRKSLSMKSESPRWKKHEQIKKLVEPAPEEIKELVSDFMRTDDIILEDDRDDDSENEDLID